MKTKFYPKPLFKLVCFAILCLFAEGAAAQNATAALPMGIGRTCGKGTATFATTDSFKVLSYNDATNTLSNVYSCHPKLATPSFSPYSGSIAFNPQDQMLYYIETTNGTNSYIYRWQPNTCPTDSLIPAYAYTDKYIVGLDFNPVTGDGYQLEFNGATAPYVVSLRKVNFGTGTFGPSDTLVLSGGKKIYQQSGDIVFTPLGQLYFAFNNKLFQVDYSNYGPGAKLNATYIDTLKLGNTLLGLAYAQGKFIASLQNGNNSTCSFKEIDISTGTAVINSVTVPLSFTGTDLASLLTGIGVAKNISAVAPWSSGRWIIQYDIKVKNYGNTNLTNVQLKDSLPAAFGSVFTSAYVEAVGTLPAGLTLNPFYDGNSDPYIFTGGASGSVTSTLKATPPDSATVRVTAILTNPVISQTYKNTAIAYAKEQAFGKVVTDSSNYDPGLRPDPNNNSVPDDASEDLPTPLTINNYIFLSNNIVDFNAAFMRSAIGMHWKIQNAENGLKMNVQKSTDGVHFVTIGRLISTGDNAKDYNWTDGNPADINYYRIECLPSNGATFYSNIVTLAKKDQGRTEVQISPNPFRQAINFNILLKQKNRIVYKLIDFHSRVVATGEKIGQAGENRFTINNLERLPAGPYLLQAIAGDEMINKVIIKN